jgi:hypothetical protein
MTDRRLNGQKIRVNGTASQAAKDAQACHELCVQNDAACIAWQFKEIPGPEAETTGSCVLFDHLWMKSPEGTVNMGPGFVSGIKEERGFDIIIKDDKFEKPWLDLNAQAAAISQGEP